MKQSRLSDYEPRDLRAQTDVVATTDCGNGYWDVKSRSGNLYTVTLGDDGDASCTCPDHEYRDQKCKHIRAVEMTAEPRTSAGGGRE